MSVIINPYLHLSGNAEAALHFYESVFGGEGKITRYGDQPMPDLKEEHKNLVMHSELKTDDICLMLGDSGPMGTPVKGSDVSIALSGSAADEAKMTEWFNKLAHGGKVEVPLSKAGWGDTFGMVDDKYGFNWFINISAE